MTTFWKCDDLLLVASNIRCRSPKSTLPWFRPRNTTQSPLGLNLFTGLPIRKIRIRPHVSRPPLAIFDSRSGFSSEPDGCHHPWYSTVRELREEARSHACCLGSTYDVRRPFSDHGGLVFSTAREYAHIATRGSSPARSSVVHTRPWTVGSVYSHAAAITCGLCVPKNCRAQYNGTRSDPKFPARTYPH
ncbi:hypothetical protein BC834DRAFT_659629 [Gloeopeniophorella convolvens]|nr:hypothetical protein BC834DRAFT_659629 [Gloeopeniophorella convolvens]